jgi:hypothetical protein
MTIMSYSISTLLTRNLSDVFAENDPARRRAALDELWTEDGVFYDPNSGIHRGRDEIDRIAGAIKAAHPDFRYQPIAEDRRIGQWRAGSEEMPEQAQFRIRAPVGWPPCAKSKQAAINQLE